MILKKIVPYILALPILGLCVVSSFAAEPSFSIYPSNGVVKDASKGFTFDVLLNSGEYSITKAMFTITFDPRQVQVVKALKNNSLFDQWPDDESTIDNENGVLMLTGFTQSGGSNSLYQTGNMSDIMARVEFEVITKNKEEIPFNFEFTGSDNLFTSVIMKEGSPPSNVLDIKPQGAKFSITGYVSPSTALEPSHVGVIVGVILIAVGIFITTSKVTLFSKRKGTVVLYE